MAADLFESYAVTLVAALILGQVFFGAVGMVFPLLVAAIGVIASVVGVLATRPAKTDASGMAPINRGFFASAAVSLVLVAAAAFTYLPSISDGANLHVSPQVLGFLSVLVGVVLAAAIQQLTGYFTETSRKPVRDIGRSSLTGPATVILSGISLGLESAVYAAILIGAAVYGAFLIGGGAALYAVALAGCGLLTTAGVIVAMDTFGPVSDNAQGIAEMSGDIDEEGARVLTDLDAVGNTTKAITKGIAIATAVLAATALFGSYNAQLRVALDDAGESAGDSLLKAFSLVNPNNVVGAILGAAVVFFFSGLAISAVSRAAGRVVFEVREQFRTRPGIMDYSERPDYSAVVDICTKDSLRELATPGLLAVLAPVAVGFGLGFGPLAAYLVGAIAAGTLMAVFLANSGGAWDNAKKMVEDGAYGGKGSEAHAATVIGDTVGDPFKDTAGPAINPLIKVMNLVALIIAPAVVGMSVGENANTGLRVAIALVAVLVIVASVVVSKRRSVVAGGAPSENSETLARSTAP
jgi:K(+)-stimulated pyrophosphate-energized sodium pump